MITFTIEPLVGPSPLRFGMTPAQVEVILGPPDKVFPSHSGNRTEIRKNVNLGYSASEARLVEAVFTPGSTVQYRGKDLFLESDLIGFLRESDPAPQLCVGFVVFLKLGTRLSGFHDNDESQKA